MRFPKKNYKNKLNHSLRNAKRIYYEKRIEYAKSNSKNTWKISNEVINRKKRATKLPSTFITDYDHEISNPVELANRFCDYFTKYVGPNLVKKIPASTLYFSIFPFWQLPKLYILRACNPTIDTRNCQFFTTKGLQQAVIKSLYLLLKIPLI